MDATLEWLAQELDVQGLDDFIACDSSLGAPPPQSVGVHDADGSTEKNAAADTLVQNFLSTSWGDFVDSVGVEEAYPDTNCDVEIAQGDDDDDDDGTIDDTAPYPVPSLLPPKGSSWKMPIFILSHHHHIIQFVHVDPANAPPRHATNLLSNSGSDISHHYHVSRHVHHLHKCHVHIPTAHKEDINWEPHVRMRSCTLGTFSTFSLQDAGFPSKTVDPNNNKKQCARKEEKAKFVQFSHHFIHLHEVFCKDLCFDPPWLPKDHACRLLHLQSKKPDPQGFFLMNVTIETTTRSATECKRWRDTNLGQFEHFHSHYHTLHINATKDPPSEEGPHALYTDFMVSKESPYTSKPTSPYST